MPPMKLDSLKDIATIVQNKYGNHFHVMHFFFCYKIERNKYIIFQEIQSMPIKRLVYREPNNSVSLVAAWSAWGNPFATISDANNERIEKWKDLMDRSRPYNAVLNSVGAFDAMRWRASGRQNTTEKEKRHKRKQDVFVEFRVDKIERAAFYRWGFELFSPALSLFAVKRKNLFPYLVKMDIEEEQIYPVKEIEGENSFVQGTNITHVSWSGKRFDVTILRPRIQDEELDPPTSIDNLGLPAFPISIGNEALSYWDKNECDPENDEFDRKLADIILNNKKEYENDILDVGQRNTNLLLD